jgi:LCP family protein required for cell wall assembly
VVAFSLLNAAYALAVLVLAVMAGLWRAASIVHAYAVGSSNARRPTRLEAGVVGALLAGVLIMHTVPAYYAWSFFVADTQFSKPIDQGDWQPVETPDPSALPVLTTIDPSQSPAPEYLLPGNPDRVTVLLTGIDFGPGRTHALNDSMIVLSVQLKTKQVSLVSVPRDTTMFPLYWTRATLGPKFKLNALSTGVANKWFTSPDSPMATLENEIGYIMGVKIDYYMAMDLQGFVKMVDLAGGVDVVNPKAFYDPLQKTSWPAGKLHLDGEKALLYVRSRYADSDYRRSARQQEVLVSLGRKLSSPSMLVELPKFLDLAGSAIRTDFPLDNARSLAEFAQSVPPEAITKCVLGPPYSWHPDSAETGGLWTSRLNMDLVASLSVYLYGQDSAYYEHYKPAPCA